MNTEFIFTADDKENWFHQKYYWMDINKVNDRYHTFHLALNLLSQLTPDNPLIVETGCQRERNDFGAGQSTSIFVDYLKRYGGKLISIDNNPEHVSRAIRFVEADTPGVGVHCEFMVSDSLEGLQLLVQSWKKVGLLYLDSLDYPIGDQEGDLDLQKAAQMHCFNEFVTALPLLTDSTVLLLDDNQLSGGGKTKLVKEYLIRAKEWKCLLDLKQSVWVKRI